MSRLISIAEASEMLGITTKTPKIWTNEKKIKSYRTAGNHRRFRVEDIEGDLISIVTCFFARLHGARGGKKLKEVIAELETERGENIESNNASSSY